MRVVVYHGTYECDTGCCGHWVEIDGNQVGQLEFEHPRAAARLWAIGFARRALEKEGIDPKHAEDLDWENSYVSYD